jgi:hypothetical protein
MAEQENFMPRNKVMKVTAIGAFVLTAALMAARAAGVLPMPQDMSPPGAIAFCVAMTAAIAGFCGWYFTRTDEHDLHANLWSMTWAWISFALITVDWAVLHVAGLAPVPNAVWILLASAAIAAGIWAWLRFR